jgi:riboflavin kinase/FMN adenylyltransferase
MRIVRNPKKAGFKNTIVALGNFDGVHLGHAKILRAAASCARKLKTRSVALTFDPHPQQFIRPERGLRLLTTLAERERSIKEAGVDNVCVIKFNRAFRGMSCERFVKEYLLNELDARVVFVGYDYAFGRDRKGDVSHLKKLGAKLGFAVEVVKPVSSHGAIIKSRVIREFISAGRLNAALVLLGHAYVLGGRVVRGMGRGTKLGFPTANLLVDVHKLIPAPGVYAGTTEVKGELCKCVVNIGNRPTFPKDGGAVEVHILDHTVSLRGRRLEVMICARFRDERQFSDVRDLVGQIKADVRRARRAIKI